MREEVVAVVPLHNPDAGVHERLERIGRQVAFLVVVDDGSDEPFVAADSQTDMSVIRQPNAGIARALNVGIRRALAARPSSGYVLTVDQDSLLDESFVAQSVRAFTAAQRDGVDVAATATERHNEKPAAFIGNIRGHRIALHVAQSGMVFSRQGLEQVGLFDDSLVIDVVETDWCLRARRLGKHVVLARGTSMEHPVGDVIPIRVGGQAITIAGRERTLSHHSALRRYYITRNRVLVYPRYRSVAAAWLLRDTVAEARTLVLSLLLGRDPAAQLFATIWGLVDGVVGRRGKAADWLVRSLEGANGKRS